MEDFDVLKAREQVGPAAEVDSDQWCIDCGHWHGVHEPGKCCYWTGLCTCTGFVKRSDALAALRTTSDGKLSPNEALEALNTLRSNIVGTQRGSWSNTMYPLVAILNAAGLEQFDPSEEQLRQHMDCYGGAGGYPGHELSEPDAGWCPPVGRLQLVSEAARWFLDDPSEKNRRVLEARLERA